MPNTLLTVSHLQQQAESDCLPICAQMVLAFLGQNQTYESLAELLGTRRFGTPADNILRLDQIGVHVTLAELSLPEILEHLSSGRAVIAFVNTADLPYWQASTDHAVVLVGMDEQAVYLNDPYFSRAPRRVPQTLFELSMLRFDNRCAVLEV